MECQEREDEFFFKPKLILKIKRKNLKQLRQSPKWEDIQQVVESIESQTITIHTIKTLNNSILRGLTFKDLCGSDIAYHLISNTQFDLFIDITAQVEQLFTSEFNQVLQSAIKGILLIKKENNHKKILTFIKQLTQILHTRRQTENAKAFEFNFDFVICSRFNYVKNLWELKLLLNIYKLLGNYEDEISKLKILKISLTQQKIINSNVQERSQISHLKIEKYISGEINTYTILIQKECWDLILKINPSHLFAPLQDGFSIYMKLLKAAPFNVLVEFHQLNKQIIKENITTQHKGNYNILHFISENRYPINEEFIQILQDLNVNHLKQQAYFDQIPAVLYLQKSKSINHNYLKYLLEDAIDQNKQSYEGLQLLIQLYARKIIQTQNVSSKVLQTQKSEVKKTRIRNKRSKNNYIIKNYPRKNYKKVKSKYKQNKILQLNQLPEDCKQCAQNIYENMVTIHKIFNFKKIIQEFNITQYSFSLCHFDYNIFQVDQPLALWIQDSKLLNEFLTYLDKEFCSNINQQIIKAIEVQIKELNLNISIDDLIVQRKIIILNALLKQDRTEEDKTKIKNQIFTILTRNQHNYRQPFCSYSKYQTFQDYLISQNLITYEEYQVEDAFSQVINLLKLKYENETNILGLAKKIDRSEQYPSLHNVLQILFQQKLLNKVNRLYELQNQNDFLQELFKKNFVKNSFILTPKGIELLFQVEDKNLNSFLIKRVLYNFQEECVFKFFQLFYEIEQTDFCLKKKRYFNLIICNLTQQQLGLVFYYQLQGVRVQFNLIRKKQLKFQSNTIQEEIVLKQIYEKKNFLQVLVSNDRYSEFLQVSLKYFPLFQKGDDCDYVLEALNNEAYKNLAILEKWIFDRFDECLNQKKYQKTIFTFLRYHSFVLFGVFGKDVKQADRIKFNRQIKHYYNIFERQIQLQQNQKIPIFLDFGAFKKYERFFVFYLDKENSVLFSKYLEQFFDFYKSSFQVNYVRHSENPLTATLLNSHKKFQLFDILAYWNLNTRDESEMKFIIENFKSLENDEKQNFQLNVYKQIVKYYLINFQDIKFIEPYFKRCIFKDYEIRQLFQQLLQKKQIRQLEFILINRQVKPNLYPKFIRSSDLNYMNAIRLHWSLSLTNNQFRDLIQNNIIENEQKQQVLEMLTNSGHFEKLSLVTDWINSNDQIIELTSIACSLLIKEYKLKNKKFQQAQIPSFMYQKMQLNFTLSKEINNSVESNNLFTNRLGTANLLYNLLSQRDIDLKNYFQNYLLFQILFPNPKWTFDNPNGDMLSKFITLMKLNLFKDNWKYYVEIIIKNAVFYFENLYDFSYVITSIRYIDSWNCQKGLIDTLIPIYENISKDHPITNQLRQIQTRINLNKTEKVKNNQFAKELQNEFEDIQFNNLNINKRQANIYHGLPFENTTFNEVDLFLALMGRKQNSILTLLKHPNIHTATLINKFHIVQYLIKNGHENTVIEVLKLLTSDEINESLFYYEGQPLLTYIVFKKWYKLYNFASKYLINQWILKPKILEQKIKSQVKELTIYEFSLLNQFYVYFELPIEKKFILRTSQFLIPNPHNSQLKAYRIYSILKILFNKMSLRKLEIISLQFLSIKDDTCINLSNLLNIFGKNQYIESLFLSIYDDSPNQKKELILDLMDELGISSSTSLQQFNKMQLESLFNQIYKKHCHYNFLIEKIVRLSPNSFIDTQILDSPKLALIIAQNGDFKNLQDLASLQNCGQSYLRLVSVHFIRIILMIKYGQSYDPLIESKDINNIHMKQYVDALDYIEQEQQGSISIQFMNQLIPMLNVENSSLQYIDEFYGQLKSESNQIKKAFKIIIKLKEFNYQLQQLELRAIAKSDYLVNNYKFKFGEQFNLLKKEESYTIILPFNYQETELEEFLNNLPNHFKELYQKAILNQINKLKGLLKTNRLLRKKKQLDIKFEENNLSPLYNDLRYQIYLLNEQRNPVDTLEYKNQYQIKGWQELSKKDHDENCFVYTSSIKFTSEWAQNIFFQEPQQFEFFKKYPNLILIFFGQDAIFNQVMIQEQLVDSLKQIIRLSTQGLSVKGQIQMESFMKVFFLNKKIYKIFDNWYNLINGLSSYHTLITTLKHILSQVEQFIGLFELDNNEQIIIKFQQTDNQGISPQNNYLDDCFFFCKPSVCLETNKLIVTIQISEFGQKVNVENYLEQIYNQQDIDGFLIQQFQLNDNLDALILRYQLEQSAKETCEKFRIINNIDILIKFDKEELRKQIETLDYEQQQNYLSKFKLYFNWILDIDLWNIINGNRFTQFYKENLCSGKIFKEPLDIGSIFQYNINSIKNSFGILLNKEEFLTNTQKKRIYHVFYTKDNRNHVAFCQFFKSVKNRNYFIQFDNYGFMSKQNKRANFQIKSENIKGAIFYTYQYITIIPQQHEKVIFIDNEGHYYFNKDFNFTSQIKENTSLSENINVTKLSFSLSFSRENIGRNILYFNQVDFRLKDYLETSYIESDKSYKLQRLKLNRSVIKIDSSLVEYDGPYYQKQQKNKGKQSSRKSNTLLLTILSYVQESFPTLQEQNDIPNQNTKLDDEKLESLKEYCKQYRKQQFQTRAGELRTDRVHFFDSVNNKIKDQRIINDIKSYIQHEKFEEIVHYPTIKYNEGVLFQWTPIYKGNYHLVVNGHKMNFKFAVIASNNISYDKFILKQDVSEFQYFVEQDIQFELFDVYNNIITKSDELKSGLSVSKIDSDLNMKQRSEYNDVCCQLFIQFCDSSYAEDKSDECKLEINLNNQTIIQGKLVFIKPQPLTQRRIDAFAQRFQYRGSIQFLIIRANFLNSLAQMNGHQGQKTIKINFLQEIANDQGGPTREFFSLLGNQLKDPENNLFKATHIHGYYYLNSGIFLLNDSISFAFGMLFAYAFANKLKIGISLAQPFWKIICELKIEFTDLSQVVDPQTYSSYLSLRDLSDDQLISSDIYFVHSNDVELCANGKQRKVDKSNLEEYLLLSTQYQLYGQYENFFKAFKLGFKGQFDPKLLIQSFSLFEINKLIDIIDYQINKEKLLKCINFQRNNQGSGNYFAQYICDANQELLERFLTFITGSKFINFENFKIEVQVNLDLQKTRLPVTRTCSNVLIIPYYPTYDEFKSKMDTALDWGLEFFGQG